MRILLISFVPLDRTGGGEAYTLETFRSLVHAGDDAALCSPVENLAPNQRFRDRMESRFTFTALSEGRPETKIVSWRNTLNLGAEHDILWIHQPFAGEHLYDAIAATACDQHLFFTNLGLEIGMQKFSRLYQPSPMHRFVEISGYAAKRLGHLGPAIGVSAGIWSSEIAVPRSFEAGTGAFTSVGRVLPHKGFEVTIDALRDGESLEIIGPTGEDGAYEFLLRERIGNKSVAFHGAVASAVRDEKIRHSIALIASSTHRLHDGRQIPQPELLGLVLMEAAALGTVPIASDIPSFREVMERMSLGAWLYPERSEKDLRHRLDAVCRLGSEERRNIVVTAQDGIRKNFLWDDYWARAKRAALPDAP